MFPILPILPILPIYFLCHHKFSSAYHSAYDVEACYLSPKPPFCKGGCMAEWFAEENEK